MAKELFFLSGEIRTPPLSPAARREAGYLLRMLQEGESLGMPHVRPMPGIAARCLELRVNDISTTWRIICRVDSDAIVIAEVFEKKTRTMPNRILQECRRRLSHYDNSTGAKP